MVHHADPGVAGVATGSAESAQTVVFPERCLICATPWQLGVLAGVYSYNFSQCPNFVNALPDFPQAAVVLDVALRLPYLQ